MEDIAAFFENYRSQATIFQDRKTLQSDHQPDKIIHRDEQISAVARILAPLMKNEKPNNIFIYGYPGTGKTLVARYTANQLSNAASGAGVPLQVSYINCKLKRTADTEYRLIAQLAKELGKQVPVTGLPTEEVYRIFCEELDKQGRKLLLILDEIDALVAKNDDQLIYNLVRINEGLARNSITLVGISNNTTFKDGLDPRIRSSLSEEEIVFPRYNAMQLLDILEARAAVALRPGVLENGLLQKCAALAAQDHGDSRRAITLLRTSAELAERANSKIVTLAHLDCAEAAIEHDSIIDVVKTQPKQHVLALNALLTCCSNRQAVFTGEIYERYISLCGQHGQRPLTQRRIADIIQEFDMLGIITSRVISKGRYGRTREITISLPSATLSQICQIVEKSLS
jgi:cell division control protein 6